MFSALHHHHMWTMKGKVSAVLSLLSIIQLDSASWLLGLSAAIASPQLFCAQDTVSAVIASMPMPARNVAVGFACTVRACRSTRSTLSNCTVHAFAFLVTSLTCAFYAAMSTKDSITGS